MCGKHEEEEEGENNCLMIHAVPVLFNEPRPKTFHHNVA